MARSRRLALFAAFAGACSAQSPARVTPLEKVITLIQGLKAEVIEEGKAEAKSYDEFSCFCKSKTDTLSGTIKTSQGQIDVYSADLASQTASKEDTVKELGEEKVKKEQLSKDLRESESRCAVEKADYEASNADLSKALSSLAGAIKAMEDSKPSLVQVRETVKQNLALAEALQLVDQGPKWRSAKAFVQVDPQDPDFKYHSQDIISILNKLSSDFLAQKSDADSEWGVTETNCRSEQSELGRGISLAGTAITAAEGSIATLSRKIGESRGWVVYFQDTLKDDKLYLEDLTKMCEQRAKDWDQRSATRADELGALTKAEQILTDDASSVESVNKRALLLQQNRLARTPAPALSFLQQHRQTARGAAVAATIGAVADQHAQGTSTEVRRARALATLREAGGRLGSTALAALASRAAADPFAKVKTLIQKLVERLLNESTEEATKKGFCDKKLGETTLERDYRLADVKKFAAQIIKLQAEEEELKFNIGELKKAIENLNDDLTEADRIRGVDHRENLQTIQKAQQGETAVAQAIDTLTLFYKQAAKAAALMQQQASPVDEDTSGAGFEGSYKGKQAASEGILGILEVVKSDFQHTIKVTNQEEHDAQAAFVDFERASKSDISGKTMTQTRSEEDLETTQNTKENKFTDLKNAQDMVDSSLMQLEELKPMCIDTGMSYDDRVAKREEEIQALKTAMCFLDEEGVEPDCPVNAQR